MDADEWRQEALDGVDELRSAIEKWKNQLKKDMKSFRESLRYKARNLKARTQNQIAGLKQKTDE